MYLDAWVFCYFQGETCVTPHSIPNGPLYQSIVSTLVQSWLCPNAAFVSRVNSSLLKSCRKEPGSLGEWETSKFPSDTWHGIAAHLENPGIPTGYCFYS